MSSTGSTVLIINYRARSKVDGMKRVITGEDFLQQAGGGQAANLVFNLISYLIVYLIF